VLASAPLIIPFMQPWIRDAGRRRWQETFMYDTYIIETRKGAAGIVVRDGHGFRFFAATQDFYGLEGQVFGSPKEAEAAALRHIGGVRKLPKAPRGDDVALQWSS
jgi:hypothetical protein